MNGMPCAINLIENEPENKEGQPLAERRSSDVQGGLVLSVLIEPAIREELVFSEN